MKKLIAVLLTISMGIMVMAGCGSESAGEAAEGNESAAEEEKEPDAAEEKEPDTGDASLDKVRNEDGIGEEEILVVSFGTSFNDSRRKTIGAVETAIEESFPDISTRRAFTSQIVIDHIKDRDGVSIDNVKEALDRAVDNGVKTLVVQPTHLMNGIEYNELTDEIASYSDAFEKVAIGDPLLTTDDDFKAVAEAMVNATKEYDDGKTAICFMGHGTEADSNAVYEKMQSVLDSMGAANYFIGTVEATPTLDDVMAAVKAGDYERVVLEPMMVVAGDHANNDMAGDEDDSWKSVFEAEGYEVIPVLRGLGELDEIQRIYVDHTEKAVNSL